MTAGTIEGSTRAKESLSVLALGAIGVVFGDIGTSPLYALHSLKHNQVRHKRMILLNVKVETVPYVDAEERLSVTACGGGFFRIVLRYNFMDEIDVLRELAGFCDPSGRIAPQFTSYCLGRQKLIATHDIQSMALWREHLFAWMLRVSESAMDYFKLPTNRVIEVGSQLRI